MARSKKDVAENIRSSVVSPDVKVNQRVADVKSNIDVAKTVQSVAVHIKTLTEQEKEFFEKLLKGVAEIPKNNQEFQRYQKRLYEDLIKTTAIIQKAAEEEKDAKKKEELVKAAQEMEQKGKQLEVETDEGPRSFKESMAQRHFGLAPQRVRKEGFFKSLKSTIKEGIIPQNEERFSSSVDLQKQALDLNPEQFKPEESEEKSSPSDVFSKLLTEVTTIRKVVEGRIKFDPNSKGNKYYELGEKGKKRSISSAEIREAGAGLYTKKELAEQNKQQKEDEPVVAKVKKQKTKKYDMDRPLRSISKTNPKSGQTDIITAGDARYADALASGEYKELEDNPYVNVSPEEREKALSLMPKGSVPEEEFYKLANEAAERIKQQIKENPELDISELRQAELKKLPKRQPKPETAQQILQKQQDAEILDVEDRFLKKQKDSKRTQQQKDKDQEEYVAEREKVEARHKKQKEKLSNKKQETEGQDTEDEQNENKDRDVSAVQKDEARFLASGVDTETDVKPEEKEKEKQDTGGGGGGGSALMDIASSFLTRGGGRLSRGARGASRLFKGASRGTARALNVGKGLLTRGAGKKLATKAGTKIAAKGVAKAVGKSVLKKIPLIGLAAGIGFGINRALKGDFMGALGEVASGAASTIPGIGTAASVAIDAGLAAKDIKQEMSQEQGDESSTVQATTEPTQPSSAPIESQLKQQATGAATTTAKLESTQQRIASQKIQQGPMPDQTQQPPVVNNITNNNYQGGKGKSDSSIEKFMPPVRPTDTTFLRYQDKRMTRVL